MSRADLGVDALLRRRGAPVHWAVAVGDNGAKKQACCVGEVNTGVVRSDDMDRQRAWITPSLSVGFG